MFNVPSNRNEEMFFFLWFLVKVTYQPVPIIITDQFNKNVWKFLNSGTVYTKLPTLSLGGRLHRGRWLWPRQVGGADVDLAQETSFKFQ